MKRFLVFAVCVLMIAGVYLSFSAVDSKAPTATAEAKKFSGTVYVAGMGGHFAAADVEVDPNDAENPIKIKNLDRIVIGTKDSHPTHDPRIDVNDRTKMYWSTYKADKAINDRTAHIGVSDLKTGKVIKDVPAKIDDRAKWTGALYCASGQTKTSYIPLTMTQEAFIDVFDKKDFKLKSRVFLNDFGYNSNYFFFHGTNSPDMKKFFVTINMTEKWAAETTPADRKGVIENLILDAEALEKGQVKILAKGVLTGDPKKTLTFRQQFTPDGKYILQSAADRFYLINATTLAMADEEMMTMGENHDAITSPDGNYAVLTLRSKVKIKLDAEDAKGSEITDGTLVLYDIANKKVVGNTASVCYGCHKQMGLNANATLCGADANWK